jgi:triacylglycerol lipase
MKKVDPYKTCLNSSTAYWMARIAKAVYLKKADEAPDEEAILADLKAEDTSFRSVLGTSKNSAQAALVEHSNYICLAFRGTDEISDWLDNLNIFSEKVLFGEFHRGFWKSLDDVWGPLFAEYQQLRQNKRRPLFLTGHSLGGAMAAVAAARLIHSDLPFTSVYTFGQPRTMTLATARIFNVEAKSKFFRFQNNNDIVTRIPARLMGYSHVGSYLYISEEKKLHNDPGFWLRFLDSIDGVVSDIGEKGLDGIADHDMGNYLEAVTDWKCEF